MAGGEDPLSVSLREKFRTNPPPARPDRPSRSFRELPSNARCPIFIEILGTTKELIELSINDSTLLKRPTLQLTNATELLGPLPPPRHFVEELVGGKKAYDVVAQPDKVDAWLLTSGISEEKKDRAGPVKLSKDVAKQFSDVLLSFDSYVWQGSKNCIADYGARLRFTKGTDSVEVRLCYECDILEVSYKGKTQDANFDRVHGRLVKAIQSVFPNDQTIRFLQ